MRVLVTGGAGFIGSALVRHLVALGVDVVNLDKLTYAACPGSLAACEGSTNYRLVRGDVADAMLLREVLAEARPDAVAHLAAETHVDRSIDGPSPFIETNIVGTFVLLEETLRHWRRLPDAARDAFRIVHLSTDEVFGSLGAEGFFVEATPYDPSSPYSASKAAADHLVRAWQRTYGLPAIICNGSNTYGPFQHPEKLIPLMTIKALRGEPLPVYGTGANIRDWLFVDGHVQALELVLRHGRAGESYVIGGGAERTNLEVVHEICRLVDEQAAPLASGRARRSLVSFVADRPGHDLRYAIDHAKLTGELGWRPSETFATGLARTVAWYLAHEAWWGPLLATRGTGDRLGAPA